MADKFPEVKEYWEAEKKVIEGLKAQGAIIDGEEARRIEHKAWLIEHVEELRADMRLVERDNVRYIGERNDAKERIAKALAALAPEL